MNSMISMQFGDVRKKKIITPNDFVSHMIEHIAWRLGVSISLLWGEQTWRELGKALGAKIRKFPQLQNSSAELGMIDDGSAEVTIEPGKSGFRMAAFQGIDLDWFLRSRCEQLNDGSPLVELLEGLSEGLQAQIGVTIGNVEDPHHSWEGIFRAVGIALGKLYTPREEREKLRRDLAADISSALKDFDGEVRVLDCSANAATVRRGTAESGVTVRVSFGKERIDDAWRIEVADSILDATAEAQKIITLFTKKAGFSATVEFEAKVLNSSHVVFEDIGLAMGRALFELLKIRMEKYGINGAGSNIENVDDIARNPINVAVSVEGRKSLRFIPSDGDANALKQKFLIGQNILGTLRSEDLDDFLDGLTGGMNASVIIHLKDCRNANEAWQEVFQGLGCAVGEAFDVNPYRRGVPPGVKATLS